MSMKDEFEDLKEQAEKEIKEEVNATKDRLEKSIKKRSGKVANAVVSWGGALIGITLLCAFIYFSFWIVKKTSYEFFYEDFVRQTVIEMVKPEHIKPDMLEEFAD